MANRPPQRPQRRLDSDAAPLQAGVARSRAEAAAPAPDASGGGRPLPSSREGFIEMLGEMRAQGALAVADEAAILREYDLLLDELKGEKSRLEAEFRERTVRDGDEAGKAWLAEAAETLGRHQGARMRHLFQTIPALSQSSSPERS
jgi:hypothetical protein